MSVFSKFTIPCRFLLVASGIAVLLLPATSEAQIVRLGAGAGVNVNAPGVNVNVPPINALAARGAVGRRFLGRRRAMQQQAAQGNQQANRRQPQRQQPAQGQQPGAMVPDLAQPRASVAVAGAPVVAAPLAAADAIKAKTLPTPDQLATMDAAQLGTTLHDVSSQLHVRLSNLKTGEGWQRYLKIPGALLDAPLKNPEALAKTLGKYESVAGNPRYAKLAGLPEFIATGATLRELASMDQVAVSSGGPELGSAGRTTKAQDVVEEVLPTPAEPQQPNATRGERSILKRASR